MLKVHSNQLRKQIIKKEDVLRSSHVEELILSPLIPNHVMKEKIDKVHACTNCKVPKKEIAITNIKKFK